MENNEIKKMQNAYFIALEILQAETIPDQDAHFAYRADMLLNVGYGIFLASKGCNLIYPASEFGLDQKYR